MTKTTFDWDDSDRAPYRPPTPEEAAEMRQRRFEQNWSRLSPLEKQKLACEMNVQLIHMEEKVRLLYKLIEQKEEMLNIAIKLGISQLQLHAPGTPCPFIDFDPQGE